VIFSVPYSSDGRYLNRLVRLDFLPVGGDAGGGKGGELSVGEDGSSSEGSMANQVQSKCLCCGDNFTVDVRNRGRQKYCAKKTCRAAGKAARQRLFVLPHVIFLPFASRGSLPSR
jgi:hypothetical protein